MPDISELVAELTAEKARAEATVETLGTLRAEVNEHQRQLEGPAAALDHVDYFSEKFRLDAETLGSILAGLAGGVRRADIEALRQLASNGAVEQRRVVMFRDKWVNKPLPYEARRAMLTSISNVTRDQLDGFRRLAAVADALEAHLQPETEKDAKAFDRRALFTRLFKNPES